MKQIQKISFIVHEFTSPNKLPLMYQISILRRLLLLSVCWRRSRFVRAFQPPAPIRIQHPGIQTEIPLRSYLQRSEQTWCKPQTPFEVTYKDQNNTVHTPGANHKPPSTLLTKIRTTLCTHQYIACRSTYHWILLLLLLLHSMHNVTMRVVANGFDDALHIAFGETLLALHDRWMGSSLTISREDKCIMNRAVEGVLGWWPVERAGDMTCLSDACKGRKEGKTDGWTDNEFVIYGRCRLRLLVCVVICMRRKEGRT
jgi:hypothetical protein